MKESGYAGFEIPIDIYLRNKEEPKKIQFKYDLNLQNDGPAITKVQKEKYVFHNPSEEFKKRLLRGGGILVNSSIETDKNKECDNKLQLTGKPKSGADMLKKHKPKDHRSEEPKLSSFAHLFGTPISTGSKASPDPKKTSPIPPKSSTNPSLKKDDRALKEKLDKSKSKLSPSKEKDNLKSKETQDKVREDKKKAHSKDRDRSKEKVNKSAISPRPKSPKHISPSLSNSSVSRSDLEQQKNKIDDLKKTNDIKERKIKKDKKGHDRDKKDHKKDREREKESSKEIKVDQKSVIKDKDNALRDTMIKEKPREKEKLVPLKMNDIPKLDLDPKLQETKGQDKKELDKRHKHKKKDKTRKDDSKIDKEKRNKNERNFASKTREENDSVNADDVVMKIDNENVHETNTIENLSDQISSDSEESVKSVEEPMKPKPEPIISSPLNESHFNSMDKQKEKAVKKHKEKTKCFDKDDKRKKRKSKEDYIDKSKMSLQPSAKIQKMEEDVNSDMDTESLDANENNEQIHLDNESVSIEMSESADVPCSPLPEEKAFTPDYMSELKELQHKIMTLQDNTEIQDIVQMVVETGQFEITKKTFDFDLCTLDRSTVQRLQEFFASS